MHPKDLKVLKVEFLLTRQCNLSCDYCKITDASSLQGDELSLHAVQDIFDDISNLWPTAPVILFGGEPTMRDDLPEILSYGIKKGLKLAVISNSIRVLKDEEYRQRIVDSGLKNWSVSIDGFHENLCVDHSSWVKSNLGLKALRMFRDDHGFDDLVACITVTKKNIGYLPLLVRGLTEEGIWSICTPIQRGGPSYDYSCGGEGLFPLEKEVVHASVVLSAMARDGAFLMHNDPEWFDAWPGYFRSQGWKCHDKSTLTIDADGSLRRCVDQPLSKPFFARTFLNAQNFDRYVAEIKKTVPDTCNGCFWDPAFESLLRAQNPYLTVEEGRKSYRHELSDDDINKLLPKAQPWFRRE